MSRWHPFGTAGLCLHAKSGLLFFRRILCERAVGDSDVDVLVVVAEGLAVEGETSHVLCVLRDAETERQLEAGGQVKGGDETSDCFTPAMKVLFG